MDHSDINKSKEFLLKLLTRDATQAAVNWLTDKIELIKKSEADKELYLAFSGASRFVGKKHLQLSVADMQEASRIREGFDPSGWTADQAARTLLLLSLSHADGAAYAGRLNKLFSTADMGELVALYASLPLLPHPEQFKLRAAEGVRTNIGTVFEAIALNNPYPADYLDEGPWNQLVLKTVFVGKPLFLIYGLDKRRNPTLARILIDYAHERWAAGRNVTPELWRPVAPYIDENTIEDIKRLFSQPDLIQQQAAALACSQSQYRQAHELLETHLAFKDEVASGKITWNYIGEKSITLN